MGDKLPSKALFCDGKVPEPLTDEERKWLVEQLHRFPKRVHEARTCCISALTDMATAEFCRSIARIETLAAEKARLEGALREAREYVAGTAHFREPLLSKIDAALSGISEGEG